MTESEKKLEKMLKDFEKDNPDAGKNFRTLLSETPALKTNLLKAINKGNLESIEPTPPGMTDVPGFYVPKDEKDAAGHVVLKQNSIHISVDDLKAAGTDTKIANTMRMVLTHESEHAVNKQAILKADSVFEDKLTAIAKGPSPHDYTTALKEHGKSDRLREATDQIGGFNAVAAHVRKDNPNATPAQLYEKMANSSPEMAPYFDVSGTAPKQTYAPKAELKLGKDGQIAVNDKNIEAMGKYFYDARPYAERYGTRDLVQALEIEQKSQQQAAAKDPKYVPPEVRVNLKELGLDKVLTIPPGSGITDTSTSHYQSKPSGQDQTIKIDRSPDNTKPNNSEGRLQQQRLQPETSISPSLPMATERDRPQPMLYLQSRDGLERLGPDSGIVGAKALDTAAWAMAVKADKDGLREINGVVENTRREGFIAMQGIQPEQALLSYISKPDAAQRPSDQDIAKLDPALQSTSKVVAIDQPQVQVNGPKMS